MKEGLLELSKIDRSLRRIDAFLEEPGGQNWPARFRLLELPLATPTDGEVFLSRTDRVFRLVDFLSSRGENLRNRKQVLVDQFVSESHVLMQESVGKREKGGVGLTREIFDRALQAALKFGLAQTSDTSEAQQATAIHTTVVSSDVPRQIQAFPQPPVEPVKPIDSREVMRMQVQRALGIKILLAFAEDRLLSSFDALPESFIVPFLPLGSDLRQLIGRTNDPDHRSRRIIVLAIDGIKQVLEELDTKDPSTFTQQEKLAADVISNLRKGMHFDFRMVFAAVYEHFQLPAPPRYQTIKDLELNKEDRDRPPDSVIDGEIKSLRERMLVSRLNYRDECLLEFLDTFEKRVIFEDDHLLIINKPAGVSSHYGTKYAVGIIEASRNLRRQPLHLAHRLDTDTSGVLVMAKTRRAFEGMADQFANKSAYSMQKIYTAFLEGEMPMKGPLEINVPLAPTEGSLRMRVLIDSSEINRIGGQNSTTIYFPLAVLRNCEGQMRTLTDIQVNTGRTHQIRVVSADYLGHPVVGDFMYGATELVKRSLLHARELRFVHPANNLPLTVSAPLPGDFLEYLGTLDWVKEIDSERGDKLTTNSKK